MSVYLPWVVLNGGRPKKEKREGRGEGGGRRTGPRSWQDSSTARRQSCSCDAPPVLYLQQTLPMGAHPGAVVFEVGIVQRLST